MDKILYTKGSHFDKFYTWPLEILLLVAAAAVVVVVVVIVEVVEVVEVWLELNNSEQLWTRDGGD